MGKQNILHFKIVIVSKEQSDRFGHYDVWKWNTFKLFILFWNVSTKG